MIVRAAVCPGAPVLVPGIAPRLASTVPDLIVGCLSAVRSLAGADRILLLTSGLRARDRADSAATRTVIHHPGTIVSSAPLSSGRAPAVFEAELGPSSGDELTMSGDPRRASSDDCRGAAGTDALTPGVGVIVGAALLAAAGIRLPTTAIELGEEAAGGTGPAAEILRAAQNSMERVALLIIAEGSASRGPDSPGGGDERADPFDRELGVALAAGDPAALAVSVSERQSIATALMFTSGPTFTALAESTVHRPPQRADVLYEGAPFGVGYLVATWTWPDLIDPADPDHIQPADLDHTMDSARSAADAAAGAGPGR